MWISIVRQKCGKTETFKNYGFLRYFAWSRNPYNFQKMGNWIPLLMGNCEKTNIVQVYVFLTHFTWSRNRYNSQKMGWVNSHITEQVGQNTDKFCSTLEILHDVWECTNSRNMEMFCGKSYRSQAVDFWRNFRFFPPFHGE